MEQRWGEVTLQGSPELLCVPGVMPGLGPGEESGTPLPTSTASGEAPPSTGVSGESSSRSVDRLYSTICQTVGGANPGQAERAVCPWPSPSAPCPAGPPPACSEALPSCPVLWPGVPPIPVPQGRSPYSGAPARCRRSLGLTASHPPAWGLCLGTRGPYSRCRRRRLAPAARRSWWSWDRRHLRAPGDWPSPRPRLQSPVRPRRPPSQPLPQPLAPGPLPPLPAPAPPPPAAPRPGVWVWGRGGARPPLAAIRSTQTTRWEPVARPAELCEYAATAGASSRSETPETPLRVSTPSQQHPWKPLIIYIPLTQTQTLLIFFGPNSQTAGPLHLL